MAWCPSSLSLSLFFPRCFQHKWRAECAKMSTDLIVCDDHFNTKQKMKTKTKKSLFFISLYVYCEFSYGAFYHCVHFVRSKRAIGQNLTKWSSSSNSKAKKKFNEEKEATNRTSKTNQDRKKEIKSKNETEEKNARQTNLHRSRHFTFYYVCIFRLHFTRSVIRRFCIVFLTLAHSLAHYLSIFSFFLFFIHQRPYIHWISEYETFNKEPRTEPSTARKRKSGRLFVGLCLWWCWAEFSSFISFDAIWYCSM